ncbi:glycine betaine ABC transporter substrate-binding protein [Pseudonocardia sp. H11422]|uniref:glycine betaine ABC transporter substrate-binding protein n=1 Tax=Pseudonocardia sp. H11422 TaxID=2835866 RepID=UPI001BDBD890|nr:glycine betaine ABC transporter substrate-binding protein [Pseudonocardia sp. H11422]
MKFASRRNGRRVTAALAGAAVLALAGCGGLSSSGPAATGGGLAADVNLEGQSYSVGGKDFDEQLVLCQVAVAALESVNATVTDRCNTGGTEATRNALLAGDIDMYWEYNGTAWITFLKETQPIQDDAQQYEAVKQRDLAENNIEWIGRTPFSNTYAFAVNGQKAQELNLNTLSDMAAYVKSGRPGTMCIETEYNSRDDGLAGLQRTYDFQVPQDRLQIQQTGAIYQNTADGNCLFGLVFTTDGRIPQLGLTVLADDKNYHPKYNASATVRKEAFDRNPDIAKVFEPIAAALDEQTMADLNKQVSADGVAPRDVARQWLADKGFIGAA